MLNPFGKQMAAQIINHNKINIDTFFTHIFLLNYQVFPLQLCSSNPQMKHCTLNQHVLQGICIINLIRKEISANLISFPIAFKDFLQMLLTINLINCFSDFESLFLKYLNVIGSSSCGRQLHLYCSIGCSQLTHNIDTTY